MDRGVGNLDEVLGNLAVFRAGADDLALLCPSGFRRIPISQQAEYYLSIQAFAPEQPAYSHTHPDSEEWVTVLSGTGEARLGQRVPLEAGVVLGRAADHPHGFTSGPSPMVLVSLQIPRPGEGETTWDEPGETTDPIRCRGGGRCRRCHRCGGHSAEIRRGVFSCENCGLAF